MSTNFPIKNPEATSILERYADEPIGMDHPIAMMQFQIGVDATLHYHHGVPLEQAIESARGRVRYLFEEDIPEDLVRAQVSSVYAQESALHPVQPQPRFFGPPAPPVPPAPITPRNHIDIDCEYVSRWLSLSRSARDPVNIKEHKDWPSYPTATISGMAPVAWFSKLDIHDNTTKEELIAKVTEKVMGSEFAVRGGHVNWSESERIFILKTSHPLFQVREYPHVETYNCILYYTDITTKEEFVESAREIAAAWCPKACVVWSPTETIWPDPPQQDAPG